MTEARREFEKFKADLISENTAQVISQAAQEMAEAILLSLEARGLTVDDVSRQRILSCKDLPTLKRGIVQAATATSMSDVLS